MADTKISAMPVAATLDGTEIIPLVQGAGNVQQTIENTIVQTGAVTRLFGLNTTTVGDYGIGWTTLAVGGVNTNNPDPSGGEIDITGADGSVTWLYQDGPNFNVEAQGEAGAINIYSATQLTFNTALKTPQLTGYLYGNGSSGVVTAATTIPYSAISGSPANYGVFHTDTSQSPSAATVTLVNITDTDNSVNVVLGTGDSRITASVAGVYSVIISLQLENTSAQIDDFTFWPRINGVDVANSASAIGVPNKHGSINGHAIPCIQYTFTLSADDYFQFYCTTDSGASKIITLPASLVAPIHPAAPAIILSVIQVA